MNLATAALIFAMNLTDSTWNSNWGPYDFHTMTNVVDAIVQTTTDPQKVETLIKIARWETGGWRDDVVSCKVRGDHGEALGAFQVHPFNDQEKAALCSPDVSKQAAVALHHLDESIAACQKAGMKNSNLLTAYTHGHCHNATDNVAKIHWGDGSRIQALMATELDEEDDVSVCEEVTRSR